ncbi:SET domain-containing protein [Fistulina hepatica ATCC 64428]|uniref:SET domain-containing protein n=1 Tax=Fistulina hepatica ATCC 64428 TaxID=1128425 RepID=A0A0D7A870_9AGAR|nr:SET domain-containing protein [Fistulina hepatica ATCC 64428]
MRRGFLNKDASAKHKVTTVPSPAVEPSVAVTKPAASLAAKSYNVPTVEAFPEKGSVKVPSPKSIVIPHTGGNECTTEELYLKMSRGVVKRTITCLPPNTMETGCLFFTGVKERLLARPSWPSPVPKAAQNCYRIDGSSLGGLGVFAARNIKMGELIIVERPLLTIPEDMCIEPGKSLEQLVQEVLMQMPPDRAAQFRALDDCRRNGGGFVKDPMVGILNTNSFGVDILPGDLDMFYCAVFNLTSRLNHSCSPNVYGSWNVQSFSYSVRARRDISAGEELTNSYLHRSSLFFPCAQRAELLERYNFKCKCPSCTDVGPGHRPRQSDTNRKLLMFNRIRLTEQEEKVHREFQKMIDDPKREGEKQKQENDALHLLDLLEQERLVDDVICAFQYSFLCKLALVAKDENKARKWALKAADVGRLLQVRTAAGQK